MNLENQILLHKHIFKNALEAKMFFGFITKFTIAQ